MTNEIISEVQGTPTRKFSEVLVLGLRKKIGRQRNPTKVKRINSATIGSLEARRACDRVHETMQCAEIIHGATESDKTPALDGLWSTLVSKTSDKMLQTYIKNAPSVMSKSVTPIIKHR